MPLHEDAKEREPVHAGHLQVEGEDVGFEGDDLVLGDVGVHRGADNLDLGIDAERIRDHATDCGGVVDDEDADLAGGVEGHGVRIQPGSW